MINFLSSTLSPQSLISLFSTTSLTQLLSALLSNFHLGSYFLGVPVTTTKLSSVTSNETAYVNFESNDVSNNPDLIYSQIGMSNDYRNNAFTNPIISYDFKCGHYLGL